MTKKQEQPTRAGFIAILGAPNAGKSTLLNAVVGQKLAIVTPKAQTTRASIRGAAIHNNAQMIFVDTPGIFNATERFDKAMVAAAWTGAADADMILVMVDATRNVSESTRSILQSLDADKSKPAILVLNKSDVAKKEDLLKKAMELNELNRFITTFMVSAQTGDGLEDLKSYLANALPESPWFYPEDHLTDISERVLASEITREKLFLKLKQELPYSLTVETETFELFDNGQIKIQQVVVVERESQKKIVLGKGGEMLKSVGESARREMSTLWETKVHLFLFVKVRENWKNNPETYKYLGLEG